MNRTRGVIKKYLGKNVTTIVESYLVNPPYDDCMKEIITNASLVRRLIKARYFNQLLTTMPTMLTKPIILYEVRKKWNNYRLKYNHNYDMYFHRYMKVNQEELLKTLIYLRAENVKLNKRNTYNYKICFC
jgi:hypothetical protein